MLQYLSDRPDAYLEELKYVLFDEFNIEIAARTISSVLQRRRWNRKIAQRRAKERNPVLRAMWMTKSWQWPVDRLVFLDETATNEKTGQRKYGWAPIGVTCTDVQYAQRQQRWSVLPALTIDGYLPCTLCVHGSVDKAKFVWWLEEQMLPALEARYPGKEMIIILDNCSIHHGDVVRQLIAEAGHQIEYLPPYSPDLNPIEMTFHNLKQWLRSHVQELQHFHSFEDFLSWGLQSFGGGDPTGLFKHSGYNVDSEDLPWLPGALIQSVAPLQDSCGIDKQAAEWLEMQHEFIDDTIRLFLDESEYIVGEEGEEGDDEM